LNTTESLADQYRLWLGLVLVEIHKVISSREKHACDHKEKLQFAITWKSFTLQSQGRSFTLKSAASAATACAFLTIDCFASHQRLAGPGLPSAVPFAMVNFGRNNLGMTALS
jgi:hypothetical protein